MPPIPTVVDAELRLLSSPQLHEACQGVVLDLHRSGHLLSRIVQTIGMDAFRGLKVGLGPPPSRISASDGQLQAIA